MPLRGERIGTAYVKVIADGSGFADSLADELSEQNAEEEWGQQGRKDSKAYTDEWDAQGNKFGDKFVRNMVKGIQEESARFDAAVDRINNGSLDRIENQFRTRFPRIGEQMIVNFREGFRKAGGTEAFVEDFIGDLSRQALIATEQFRRQMVVLHEEALRDNATFDRERLAQDRQALDEAYRMNATFDRKRLDAQRDMLNEAYQINRDFNARMAKLQRDAYRMNAEFDRKRRFALRALRSEYQDLLVTIQKINRGESVHGKSLTNLYADLKNLRGLLDRSGGDTGMARDLDILEGRLRKLHPRLSLVSHGLDRLSDGLGTISGRGSRNNFLNFIGSMTRNFSRLVFLVPKVALKVGGEMVQAFQSAGGGVGGLVSSVGALVPLLGSLALGLTGVALAAGVLFIVMSPLVSLFSGLLGIVAALVASISFALVGALGALVAVALPAVAALAVGLGGILSMSDKMKKKFSDNFAPVIDGFRELGDVAGQVFVNGLQKQGEEAAKVLEGLTPIVRHIAQAIVDVGDSWLDMVQGRGFTQFINAMDRFLPNAIRRLGDIFGQTLGGFGGIFRGMIPFMRDVLRYLDDITERFNDWANSAEGQNSIRDFFRRAEDSIASVAGWLDSVWDLLVTIIDAGKGTGDSIFDRMARNIDEFNQFLKDNPQALKDWFDNAEELAISIGNIVVEIGELLDRLDSEEGRGALSDFLEWMANVNEIAGPLASAINTVTGALADLHRAGEGESDVPGWAKFLTIEPADIADGIGNFFKPGGTFNQWINSFGDQLERAGGWIENFFRDHKPGDGGGLQSLLVRPFTGLNEKIGQKIGDISLISLIIFPKVGDITRKFIGWGGDILRAIGDVELFKKFVFPRLGDITGKFVGWGGEILERIGKVDLIEKFDFPSLGDIAGYFNGLNEMILDAIGFIDLGSLLPDSIDLPGPLGSVSVPKAGGSGPKSGRVIVGANDPALQPFTATGIRGASSPNGKTIMANGWTIVTPTEDPEAVATEVVNQLAATGY